MVRIEYEFPRGTKCAVNDATVYAVKDGLVSWRSADGLYGMRDCNPDSISIFDVNGNIITADEAMNIM